MARQEWSVHITRIISSHVTSSHSLTSLKETDEMTRNDMTDLNAPSESWSLSEPRRCCCDRPEGRLVLWLSVAPYDGTAVDRFQLRSCPSPYQLRPRLARSETDYRIVIQRTELAKYSSRIACSEFNVSSPNTD